MAKILKKRILPARSPWSLVLILFLWGCVQVVPDENAQPDLESTAQASEEPARILTQVPSPPPQGELLTQEALPGTSEATRNVLVFPPPAQAVVQTISAQATATQAARQPLEEPSASDTAAATTPSPSPGAVSPATPIPVSLLDRFFEPLASFDAVLPGLLNDLRLSPEGILWVSNENGVASLSGTTWTLHFSDVTLLLTGFDSAGRTWMMNEPGTAAMSWDGREWRIFGDGSGWLPVRWPRLLLQGEEMVTDRTGKVWMTAFQDVRSFDGREWTVHSLRDIGFENVEETAAYEGFYFPAIEQDLQGNIWIGNCDFQGEVIAGQGARWFDGATWQGRSDPTSSGCVQDIEVDPDGRIWMGIDEFLWRYDPKTRAWEEFELPDPPADTFIGWIQDIQFGPNGNPWLAVAYCGGASCGTAYQRYRLQQDELQQDEWVAVPLAHDYDPGRFFIDPEGNAWLYSEKELFRVQGNTLEKIPGLEICCITQDSRGWLYLGAKRGQQKLILVERGGR